MRGPPTKINVSKLLPFNLFLLSNALQRLPFENWLNNGSKIDSYSNQLNFVPSSSSGKSPRFDKISLKEQKTEQFWYLLQNLSEHPKYSNSLPDKKCYLNLLLDPELDLINYCNQYFFLLNSCLFSIYYFIILSSTLAMLRQYHHQSQNQPKTVLLVESKP